MDCNDFCESLPAAADDELGATQSLRLEQHLAQCPACAAELRRLRALRTAVQRGAAYHRASPALRARIVAALPASGAMAAVQPSRPRWLEWFAWRPAINAWLAALTVASMAFALTLFTLRESPQDALAREIVSSHVRALIADHAIDVASTDRHAVKPWFNGRLDYAPPVHDMAAEGFALVGGRLDYVQGQRVAVLVYRRNQHPIDVFVLRSADAGKAAVQIDSAMSRHGYQIMRWQGGGMDYWAVTDAAAADLQRFSKAWQLAGGSTP